MRSIVSVLAAALALTTLAPDEADAHSTGYRHRHATRAAYAGQYYRRPASIGSNGLCQRDTGTPTSQLNFRNKCDTEEFWNRTMQGGRRR